MQARPPPAEGALRFGHSSCTFHQVTPSSTRPARRVHLRRSSPCPTQHPPESATRHRRPTAALLTEAWDFLTEANRQAPSRAVPQGNHRRPPPAQRRTPPLCLARQPHPPARLPPDRRPRPPPLAPPRSRRRPRPPNTLTAPTPGKPPTPTKTMSRPSIFFIAHALACLRWTLKWEPRIDLNTLTLADAQAFLDDQHAPAPVQLSLF